MKKKAILTILALQLVLTGAVGCGSSNTQTEASTTTEASIDSNTGAEQSQARDLILTGQ